ncbi:hypothetical protein OB905_12995 [Halobacteria archaeon AArc-dxtr1]|nr:hypothetical protein [Halobacteria archaeon AArc-dxtr1]
MAWQDFVFLTGSMLSVLFLLPTLRNQASRVPRATSIPSMVIGGVYAVTFSTLGMTFSAVGALATCVMWSLIVWLRAPGTVDLTDCYRRLYETISNCCERGRHLTHAGSSSD